MEEKELEPYWYLREGDYLSAPLSDIFGTAKINKKG